AFSSGAGRTADRNRSHWSTSKTPSYTKSVSWQHHRVSDIAYEHSNQLNIRRDFILRYLIWLSVYLNNVKRDFSQETLYKKI
ncbi:hypothetical protein ODR08_21995, partial [Escherichia coli]|nr:hypothetical protein [Escherichia coli]MCV7980128.1 hypothetical protein [Escherichia coli]